MEQLQADVCVVGAGFAGLAAAHRLTDNDQSVIVLEARDRVGGRVWDKKMKDGTAVSVGGTWIGKGQHRMKQLVDDAGLRIYRQYTGSDPDDPIEPNEAKSVFRYDGKNTPYKGMFVPIGIDALADLGIAFGELNLLAQSLDPDRPWEAPPELDAQTVAGWIEARWNVPAAKARLMLNASLGVMFSVDLANVSLLGSMVMAIGGGDDGFLYYADAKLTETHLVSGGGAPAVADYMGRSLPDGVLRKSTPVRRIKHSDDHVEVYGDNVMVNAKYVIVTAPPILAGQIEYDPVLPDAYSQLMQNFPPGIIIRGIALYETPIWREQGYSGFSVAPQSPVAVSIDQCPEQLMGGPPPKGVLSSYAIGRDAIKIMELSDDDRKEFWLNELADRFDDPRYCDPVDFSVTDWGAEPWSRGGMIAHFPPGILTSYGHVLHEPCGRIYWAGSERAVAMHALMEGAVRSGEETADAVSDKLLNC